MIPPVRCLSAMLVACAMIGGAAAAWAKRMPPADVPPVVSGNVRYEAPQATNPCGANQAGGCVVAYDNTSKAQLWAVQVYCTKYDSNLEQDVQDVFITSLVLDNNNQLQVTNEAGKHFTIDPTTQKVTGDARGCSKGSSSGCSYAGEHSEMSALMLFAMFGLLGIVGAVRLRAARFPR
jgi:hypothetical protein